MPTVPFSCNAVNVATPDTIETVAFVKLPPVPATIVAVMVPLKPVTVAPPASTTFTIGCTGSAAPFVAAAPGAVAKATATALVTVMEVVVMFRAPSLNWRVKAPAGPVRASEVKVATPLAMVVVALDNEPPAPEAIVAVIVPLAVVTVLPPASTIFTTGCGTRTAPVVVADGADVVIFKAAAAPALSVTDPEPTVRVPSVKESV